MDFKRAIVSRAKVVCVCQALLDCNVFEAVGTRVFGKVKKRDVFQDSRSALYRFAGVCSPSVDDLERGVLVNGIQKLFCGTPSQSQAEQTCPTSPRVQMSTSVQPPEGSTKANKVDAATPVSPTQEPLGDSGSPGRAQADAVLPQSLVDQVWLEQTLLRLLNLVELPVLEGVLQCSQAPSPPPPSNLLAHSNPDLIYSSNHLDRQILKAFRDTQEDEWLIAALDCLDFLPDQPVVELSRELPDCFPPDEDGCDQAPAGSGSQDGVQPPRSMSTQVRHIYERPRLSSSGQAHCKRLLYGTLAKHYGHTDRPPLLPQHMADVYTAITDLLVNAKLSTALEALQLCLKLLPPGHRDELCALLTFMALAADPQGMKLDKEMENRQAVKRSFSRAVLHSRVLSKEKEDLMVVFLLSNIKDIFKIPGTLHKGVSEKLASLAQGKQPDVTGFTFCQPVSHGAYNESTKKTTNEELRILLGGIHQNPKISAKERKRLLRQFYQAHPEIFNQYFGEHAVSVL
uniref:DEP domain-containing protein 7-like n=1 Tax=Gasterosteus aculeatus aculeatus TaxID=481459 RepID=UPI001A98AA4F|nr:DEP domain-containing protein 7-like [Gasterosteus aculeatus aculeatus]